MYRVYSICNKDKFKWLSYFAIDDGFYYAYLNNKYWELYQKKNISNSISGSRDDRFLQVYKDKEDLQFNMKRLTKKKILG